MKALYIKAVAGLTLAASLASCGDKFLESDIYGAIDSDLALNSATNIGYALNGTYYNLELYYFAGTESTIFGDLASDVTYWNQKSQHFNEIYSFNPVETSGMLSDIWQYGYKVVDNSTRVILGAQTLYNSVSEEDKAELDRCMAEAYALRAYSYLNLANIFCHQVKVAGNDFSSTPGLVLVKTPVGANDKVSRSTLGETFAEIENDLNESLKHFDAAGYDAEMLVYFSPAAVKALQARTYLYEEKWQQAIDAANEALSLKGINSLVTEPSAYKALYANSTSNVESFFALAIDQQTNWSANSSGTLWSTYGYSPSPWLQSIMADDDCRRAVWGWDNSSTPATPIFNGGKFLGTSGNSAYGTCYLLNAPEMFLIKAEAYAQLGKMAESATNLLTVAKRNPAITSTDDLPADKAGLLAFVKDERARELFQEGHRLFDLRRWGQKVNVEASQAPNINWMVTDYNISDCVFPIPAAEINTKAGVSQNEGWQATFPSI
ncbi:MAG: RagB/SusD family nutrient uptake outer membrane protein [Muribaculaceae bacterium]|nr:RagB/SusD family nutrient uptake outer membrane protein [Muribaculaceae bacterium]